MFFASFFQHPEIALYRVMAKNQGFCSIRPRILEAEIAVNGVGRAKDGVLKVS